MAMTRTKKLTDFFGVPVSRGLKRRVIAMAQRLPGEPTPTKLARLYLERGVTADEQALQPPPAPPQPDAA